MGSRMVLTEGFEETAAKYGDLVGEVQDRTLHLTSYSPQQQLSR